MSRIRISILISIAYLLVIVPVILSQSVIELPVLKPDFMVNSTEYRRAVDQSNPDIAMDSSGNYCVIWLDSRNPVTEVYARFYDYNNNIQNDVIVGNFTSTESEPSIAVNNSGTFIIYWQLGNTIQIHKFSKFGNRIGLAIELFVEYNISSTPSIAIDDNERMFVSWSSVYGKLYCRTLSSSGNPLTGELFIANHGDYIPGNKNRIALDKSGNAILVWSYTANNRSRIFMQALDSTGNFSGKNILVSDLNEERVYLSPTVVSNENGKFLISWIVQNIIESSNGVSFKVYDINSNKFRDQKLFNTGQQFPEQLNISSDRKGKFVILFYSAQDLIRGIVNDDGQESHGIIRLADQKFQVLEQISLANFKGDTFKFVFMGELSGDKDIYLADFTLDSEISLFSKTLNDANDNMPAAKANPLIAVNKQGYSMFIWEEEAKGKVELWGNIYDSTFKSLKGDFKIAAGVYQNKNMPRIITSLSDGSFIVFYNKKFPLELSACRINIDGTPGKDTVVAKFSNIYLDKISVGISSNDQLLICLYTDENRSVAKLLKLDKDLNTIYQPRTIIDIKTNKLQKPMSISINSKFNVLVSWSYFNLSNSEKGKIIYNQIYDGEGTALSEPEIFDSLTNINGIYNYLDKEGI